MKTYTSKSSLPLILIVDDVAENIRLIANILSNKVKCNLAFAKDGVSALETVKRKMPDLILLDVMMPGKDGFSVCKELKENDDTKDIPVIFLTAKVEEEDVAKGFDVGAADYILKPIRAKELLARVKTQLEITNNQMELNERMLQLRNLIRILCHDIANPLSATKGYISILKEIHQKDETEAEDLIIDSEATEVIEQATSHAFDIVEHVRHSLAMEEGKISLNVEKWNLKELVEESLVLLKSQLGKKSVQVSFDMSEDSSVWVDRVTFVNSVLCNVLTNAIKFSERDSVIDITTSSEEGFVRIDVKDYGIGMPVDLLKQIFDLTAKTSRLGTEGEEGTGYGMPLMKQFVEACGGRIEIESRESGSDKEKGTRVSLWLKTESPE